MVDTVVIRVSKQFADLLKERGVPRRLLDGLVGIGCSDGHQTPTSLEKIAARADELFGPVLPPPPPEVPDEEILEELEEHDPLSIWKGVVSVDRAERP